jgi:hypothetical protein
MKKKQIIISTVVVGALALACFGCTPKQSSVSSVDYSSDSLTAYHTKLGLNYSTVTEVSVASCTNGSGCHKGSWDSVVKSTDAMWAGICQVGAANPHYSHVTNAIKCSDCHSLTATSTLVCNQCHVFDLPDGWVEPDKTTTNYGVTATESKY